MHQGIGMDEFHCAGRIIHPVQGNAQQTAGRITQGWAHPFTTPQYGIAHGGMQFFRYQLGRRQAGFQRGVGPAAPLAQDGTYG